MKEKIVSTCSAFLYEFLILINLPKQIILSLHDTQFFSIDKNTPTRRIACKQWMNQQIEIKLLVCSYESWNIEMQYEFWFLYCLIGVYSCFPQIIHMVVKFHIFLNFFLQFSKFLVSVRYVVASSGFALYFIWKMFLT